MYTISSQALSLPVLNSLIYEGLKIQLSDDVKQNIVSCRNYLDEKIARTIDPIYGINTGFGSLYDVRIDSENLTKLQANLVRSHACGTGDFVPESIVKLMLLLKIRSLSYGHSGVYLETVERLVAFYNNDILPVVYTQGSLGASGDLAPLAHLALPLLGEGLVWYNGKKLPTSEVLDKFGWHTITLQSKEGLALLNGTQFMSGYGLYLLFESYKVSYMADLISSISLDGFDCRTEPFDNLIQSVRSHKGQAIIASRINSFRNNSEIANINLGFGAVGYKLIVGFIYGSAIKYFPREANISFCSSLLISSAKASRCSRERAERSFSL